MDTVKQVIVIRKDLQMGRGKIGVSCAHASLSAILNFYTMGLNSASYCNAAILSQSTIDWLKEGQTKVCVYVNNEEELIALYNEAKDMKLQCALIQDAGYTQVKTNTYTALAIGPELNEEIDKITGHLKLL